MLTYWKMQIIWWAVENMKTNTVIFKAQIPGSLKYMDSKKISITYMGFFFGGGIAQNM